MDFNLVCVLISVWVRVCVWVCMGGCVCVHVVGGCMCVSGWVCVWLCVCVGDLPCRLRQDWEAGSRELSRLKDRHLEQAMKYSRSLEEQGKTSAREKELLTQVEGGGGEGDTGGRGRRGVDGGGGGENR